MLLLHSYCDGLFENISLPLWVIPSVFSVTEFLASSARDFFVFVTKDNLFG